MTVILAIALPVLVAGAIVLLVLAIREGNRTHAAATDSETIK
jgi:hypothetical protein